MRQFFGKYRGIVINNVDPLLQGRLMVSVPSVLGAGLLSWAMPCAPYAGAGVGLFAIPPIGANIWVEFEEGKPDLPIWVGAFWGTGETPDVLALALTKIWRTAGVTLKLDDTPGVGGCTIEVGAPVSVVPAKITLGATGITLSFGKNTVSLSAASVSVNNGALEVI